MDSPFVEGLLSPPQLLLSNSSNPGSLLTEMKHFPCSVRNSHFPAQRPLKTQDSSGETMRVQTDWPVQDMCSTSSPLMPRQCWASPSPHFLPTSCLPSLHQTVAKYIKNNQWKEFSQLPAAKRAMKAIAAPSNQIQKRSLHTTEHTATPASLPHFLKGAYY